ncbi:male accessory gland serine protease inhibitor-like [Drosophila madeirensis]|uniref:Male accessory gland serine protease inhibitor-like n=1 Tax=Drosophila madeirensis TaxID=30013 RepID=A0AAU9FKS6_DROMD|nr:male accessory gland serine protease inhibitor-like [Drosophila subobscura]
MKFMLLLVVLAALVASSLGLKNEICGLPSSQNGDGVRACLAYIPSWSYDGRTCVSFIYGGCGGNDNRFASQAECEAKCLE